MQNEERLENLNWRQGRKNREWVSWFTFSQKAAPGEQRRCRQFVWEVLLGSRRDGRRKVRARERYANEGMTGVGKFVAVLLGTPKELCRTARVVPPWHWKAEAFIYLLMPFISWG